MAAFPALRESDPSQNGLEGIASEFCAPAHLETHIVRLIHIRFTPVVLVENRRENSGEGNRKTAR